jgi:hypothetical protein
MLCEHTLLPSGEIADSGAIYVGWPAKRFDYFTGKEDWTSSTDPGRRLSCPVCHGMPDFKSMTVSPCGHLFCDACIRSVTRLQDSCPVCHEPNIAGRLTMIQPA